MELWVRSVTEWRTSPWRAPFVFPILASVQGVSTSHSDDAAQGATVRSGALDPNVEE